MKALKYWPIFLLPGLLLGCREDPPQTPLPDPLTAALASDDRAITRVMEDPERYELQILLSTIHRDSGRVRFEDHSFRLQSETYFYPASTVKLPIAVLALEKLDALDSLERDTRFFIEGDTLETTFSRAVQEVFAISDNAANNRLVEFLGLQAINDSLHAKGVSPVRISHRVGVTEHPKMTRPLILFLNDSSLATSQPLYDPPREALELDGIQKGEGFYREDSLYREPFDFSLKNYYPLQAQQEVMKRVIFPKAFPPEEQFQLSGESRGFLLESMKATPRTAGYDPVTYPDGYVKFFLFGDSEARIPAQLEIYNKVGFAYGTLTDCAYIYDRRNEVEFILSATILVNENGIFNDDAYEYDGIGIPFLAQLGREVYQQLLARKTTMHGNDTR